MTAAHDFEDLRYALGHFNPEQARRLRLIISQDEELAAALPDREAEPDGEEEAVPDDLLALIGSVDTGRTDAAERHDDYIRERMKRRYLRSV